MKKNVIVVYGGKSCEHDISIITALHIYHAIKSKKYRLTMVYLHKGEFYVGKDLTKIETYIKFKSARFNKVSFQNGSMYLLTKKFHKICSVDCALLCTHGGEGEDGALQGFFEIHNIPYTSSNVFASSLTMDKVMTKRMLKVMGYEVLPYVVLHKHEEVSLDEKLNKIKFPIIIKPSKLGSSIGISVAKDMQGATKAIKLGFMYDKQLLIENCLEDFVEINCAAIKKGDEIITSSIEKVSARDVYLSYEDKYMVDTKLQQYRECPAKIDKDVTTRIQQITAQIYRDFALGGVVRIDYLLKDDKIYVNEINAIPGSLSCYLFAYQKLSVDDIVEILVSQALLEKREYKELISDFSSNVLVHYQQNRDLAKYKKSNKI